ncbi:MAG TPA: hypothetical protein VMB84_10920 [Stellaceae bacterium]|nr:hypothetical protein [Stellaceae bacterium]
MAAIENIIAWAQQEQARLAQRLDELQSGRLRAVEKHAHPPGWLEVDVTDEAVERCRQFISELSAIIALHPAVVPSQPAAPPPQPRFVPPVAQQPAAASPERPHLQPATHLGWVVGWGVVKGQPPGWQFAGIYPTHAEANAAAAKAGDGYYARWGSYNEGSREFTSGPSFDRAP